MNRLMWIDNSERRPRAKGRYLVRMVDGVKIDAYFDGRYFREGVKRVYVTHWLIEQEGQL